jgi:hypothetical protein
VSEKWVLTGIPGHTIIGSPNREGAVQVHDAKKLTWKRLLLPPPTATTESFGAACLVHGDFAIVGAPGDTNPAYAGQVFVFNLATGKLVHTLTPSISSGLDAFGKSLAASGDILAVGAPVHSGGGAQRVFLFNLATGGQIAVLAPSDPQAGGLFGWSVAAEGNLLLVGAPGCDASRGAGYLYNLDFTATQLSKIQVPNPAANDKAGYSVAMAHGKLIIGAPGYNGNDGSVFVMPWDDPFSASELAGDPASNSFGRHLAASNNLLVVHGDGYQVYDLAGLTSEPVATVQPTVAFSLEPFALHGNSLVRLFNSGASLMIRSVTAPLNMSRVAVSGNTAHGQVDKAYKSLSQATVNAEGEFAFLGSYAAGSTAPKTGVFSTAFLSEFSYDDLTGQQVASSVSTPGGNTVASVDRVMLNAPDFLLYRAKLSGPGVNSSNNTAWVQNNSFYSPTGDIIRTGQPFPGGAPFGNAGPAVLSIGQLSQSAQQLTIGFSEHNRLAAAVTFKKGPLADATNDSGLVWHDAVGTATHAFREGSPSVGLGNNFGQLSGHFALHDSRLLFSSFVGTNPANNEALLAADFGGADTAVAVKGVTAAKDHAGIAVPAVTLGSFRSEGMDDSEIGAVHATLSGDVTTATNEGIFRVAGNAIDRAFFLKGEELKTGVAISKFIAHWVCAGQCIAWVELKGVRVTKTSNQALVLRQIDPSPLINNRALILMRTGDGAPGCDGARVGKLLDVQVDPVHGQYLVLTSLTGCDAANNLALFHGYSRITLPNANHYPLRQPYMVLRKGQLYDNQPSPLLSIALAAGTRTAGGAGTCGLGSAIESGGGLSTPGRFAAVITYGNKVQQVVVGTP